MWKFRKFNLIIYLTVMILFAGCGRGDNITGPSPPPSPPPNIGNNNPNVYVALGDSITEGGGSAGASYPSRVANMTGETVINQGMGGERSEGGADRIAGVLAQYKPAGLLILYGANDVITGESPNDTIANLRAIIQAAKANQTRPIIANLTPMYGRRGTLHQGAINALNPLIQQLASAEGADFVDLASAFGNDPSLIQADGLHPSDAGTQVMASEFAKFVNI